MKWQLETQPEQYEGVTAHDAWVSPSGAVVFTDVDGQTLIAYAAGSWRCVFQDEDGAA